MTLDLTPYGSLLGKFEETPLAVTPRSPTPMAASFPARSSKPLSLRVSIPQPGRDHQSPGRAGRILAGMQQPARGWPEMSDLEGKSWESPEGKENMGSIAGV